MSLAPALLLSMPQLLDPNFARTVVLLCEHAKEGAFGLVVNRPSDIRAAEAVSLEPPVDTPNDLPLLIGGPVEPHRGWILTAEPPEEVEHRELGAGLYLSASPVLLRRALMASPLPPRTLVLAGYAGWGPGQLESGARAIVVAHHAGRARSDFRSSRRRQLGNGHPPPRRRSQSAAHGTGSALSQVEVQKFEVRKERASHTGLVRTSNFELIT